LTRRQLDGGWYRTRDLGYQDGEGNFYIVGRIDDMIISGGEHILPQFVESVLANHPKVLEVAVTGEPDNRWGQMVVAYVVPRVTGLRVFELDAYCKQQSALSLWARPRKYVFVRQIPKSATGKILRRELTNLEGSL
jgi:2-furoate---CoA ligase